MQLENASVAKGRRWPRGAGRKRKHTDEDEVECILCSRVLEVVCGVGECLHGSRTSSRGEGTLDGGAELDKGEGEVAEHESH